MSELARRSLAAGVAAVIANLLSAGLAAAKATFAPASITAWAGSVVYPAVSRGECPAGTTGPDTKSQAF
jgi:hypothetical protein